MTLRMPWLLVTAALSACHQDDPDRDGSPLDADCANLSAAIYPGAPEICGDGRVNDCDATVSDAYAACAGKRNLSDATAKVSGDADWDYLGASVSGAGDVDGDGSVDVLIGAPGTGEAGDDPGAVYVMAGPLYGALSPAGAIATLAGETDGEQAGRVVAGAEDLDGDGVDDLAVGALWLVSGADTGIQVHLWYSPVSGTLGLSSADAVIQGVWSDASLVTLTLTTVGDLNGDEQPDVVIGNRYVPDQGAIYVVPGPVLESVDLSIDVVERIGEVPDDDAGVDVANAGDVDGDGCDELLVGAPGQDSGGQEAGAAYLVHGPLTGSRPLSDNEGSKLLGAAPGDSAGRGVSGAGDVDGDGRADLLIGAPGDDQGGDGAGAAYLVMCPPEETLSLTRAYAKLVGAAVGGGAGYSVSDAGDVDGDGLGDVVVGAPFEDSLNYEDAGAAYIMLSPEVGTQDLARAAAKLVGEGLHEDAGARMANAGDGNGDGFPDLLVGVPLQDSTDVDAGAAYLILGGGY